MITRVFLAGEQGGRHRGPLRDRKALEGRGEPYADQPRGVVSGDPREFGQQVRRERHVRPAPATHDGVERHPVGPFMTARSRVQGGAMAAD